MTNATQPVVGDDPPPPPTVVTPALPPDWKTASDSQGRTYYYHRLTRKTQWEVPTSDQDIGAPMDIDTPPQGKKSKSKHKVCITNKSSINMQLSYSKCELPYITQFCFVFQLPSV